MDNIKVDFGDLEKVIENLISERLNISEGGRVMTAGEIATAMRSHNVKDNAMSFVQSSKNVKNIEGIRAMQIDELGNIIFITD